MISPDYQALDEKLLAGISVESLHRYDTNMSDIFQNAFYDLSLETIGLAEGGFVTSFLKNWKHAIGISSFTKAVPTIISGSLIEGASLSRLFRPSLGESAELEADIMYVMGIVNEESLNEVPCTVQEIAENPGFVTISPSNNTIKMLTDEVQIDEICETGDNGGVFINGSKLRSIHQRLQPRDCEIDFRIPPSLVNVERKITGPSAEVQFSVEYFAGQQLDSFIEFFDSILAIMPTLYEDLLQKLDQSHETRLTLKATMKQLIACEEKRAGGQSSEFTQDQIRESFEKISPSIDRYTEALDSIYDKINDFKNLVRRALLLTGCQTKNEEVASLMSQNTDMLMKPWLPGAIGGLTEFAKKEDGFFYSALLKKYHVVQDIPVIASELMLKEQLANVDFASLLESCQRIINDINRLKELNAIHVTNIVSFDNVSCFHYPAWPDIATEWLSRDRAWPAEEVVKSIADKGCCLVPKQSDQDESHRLEWRYSFSLAEIKIALNRTPKMSYCYFVFKSLFYRHFKTMEPSLPSYVAKTCMLLLSEQQVPEWWVENMISKCVLELFIFLRERLKQKQLQHYFISSLNLFDQAPVETMQQSLQLVTTIINDPENYILMDGIALRKLNQVTNEVSKLHQLTPSLKSNKEIYLRKTELYKEHLNLCINDARCDRFYKVYKAMEKRDQLQKFVAMHSHSRSKSDEVAGMVDVWLQENRKALEEATNQLLEASDKAEKDMIEINKARNVSCFLCDECFLGIPCGEKKYTCPKCGHDLCGKCYLENDETVSGTSTSSIGEASYRDPSPKSDSSSVEETSVVQTDVRESSRTSSPGEASFHTSSIIRETPFVDTFAEEDKPFRGENPSSRMLSGAVETPSVTERTNRIMDTAEEISCILPTKHEDDLSSVDEDSSAPIHPEEGENDSLCSQDSSGDDVNITATLDRITDSFKEICNTQENLQDHQRCPKSQHQMLEFKTTCASTCITNCKEFGDQTARQVSQALLQRQLQIYDGFIQLTSILGTCSSSTQAKVLCNEEGETMNRLMKTLYTELGLFFPQRKDEDATTEVLVDQIVFIKQTIKRMERRLFVQDLLFEN